MRKQLYLILLCGLLTPAVLQAQNAKLTLDLSKPGPKVSPRLYGLMTEEINHSYDGGLYAELIRNRIFKDNPDNPEGWSLIEKDGGQGAIELIAPNPANVPREQGRHAINDALTTCLRLTVNKSGVGVAVANEGFWGIPVKPATVYTCSFYAKAGMQATPNNGGVTNAGTVKAEPLVEDAAGPLTVSIESTDGKTIYATGSVILDKGIFWKKYSLKLLTGANIKPTTDAHFVIGTKRTGTYYFNLVSLFPPTYNNRPNGNRIDIMKMMAEMKPSFLRFPGGNFLEGDYFGTRFEWKQTLGPLEGRPGHPGCWRYRASDGMGLLEFLEWCEDLRIEPLLAVYAGYSLRGDHVDAGPLLDPYVKDALDEIEYLTGDIHTYWGAKRAADGHPAPFKLHYIEIGNEDWFDRSNSYDGRFNQFRKAIQTKYPQLRCISTVPDDFPAARVTKGMPEMIDEHYYRSAWQMQEDADHYDKYKRTGSKIFVGEWATREGTPTTNMNAALGDAAWMTGMERNSDIVQMSCYAPLFVNVNVASGNTPRAWQWDSNLIGYNAITSYGSPSYHAQKMFNNYLGDVVIPVAGSGIRQKQATRQDSLNQRSLPKKSAIPALFYVATKDTKTGALYLKVVNTSGMPQAVSIDIKGALKVAAEGTLVVLKSAKPEDTNTINQPGKILPVTSRINGLGKSFSHTFEPYSINVLKLQL